MTIIERLTAISNHHLGWGVINSEQASELLSLIATLETAVSALKLSSEHSLALLTAIWEVVDRDGSF